MNPTVTAAIVGAAGSVLAALIGVTLGRSDLLDRLLRPSGVPDLRGDWQSTWEAAAPDDPNRPPPVETITFTKVWKNRVEGRVTSPRYKGKPCRLEGTFNGRFLQLMWSPTRETATQLIDDYGCYFFEKQADGTFRGHSVGFFYEIGRIRVLNHTLQRLAAG